MNIIFKAVIISGLLMQAVVSSHIRKDLVQIEDDSIVQVDATTSLDSNSGRIAHLTNSPTGGIAGTRGIMYDLPPPPNCKPVMRSKDFIASSYIQVALITDGGECSIDTMLTQAQYDGAVGAIVYNASDGPIDPTNVLYSRISTIRPLIPVMLVDSNYGETLKLEVNALSNESRGKNNNRSRAIFVSIYPAEDNERLSGWEVSLITLVVILALCFCTSLFFHVFSNRHSIREYRRRRTLHADDMDNSSKRIHTLPPCALDRLMLRTVTEEDMKVLSECTTPLDTILNPSIRQKSVNSFGICASSAGSNTNANCTSERQHEKSDGNASSREDRCSSSSCLETEQSKCTFDCGNSPSPRESVLNGCIATCIVCIDDFVVGSRMRILPCGHNYHIECIDPWLTSKSSLCPLCKYDTRSVLTELERTMSGPHIVADDGSIEDILSGNPSYSDSSDPSSYLAESRTRMPLSMIVAEFKRVAVEKVVAPVGQIAKKMAMLQKRSTSDQREHDEKSPSEDSNTESIYYDRQENRDSRPFEDSNAIFTTSTPTFHQVDLSDTRKPEMVGIPRVVESSSIMVEVNTCDPTPSPTSNPMGSCRIPEEKTALSDEPCESVDADKENTGDNDCESGLPLRISLSDILQNDQDFMDYFD
ncbi:hypothetical protein IW140_004012 [Coemansia sp. RSA 1813]|nr:hypothetical protein EV178_003947 [Coemansia sp. RSA 1646]KAJ1771125.1 hypothetical protein LPJ74_002618 [Coemansia sp. RSA 1843]KAJ2088485.1 hypothetical protein IW138_004173 [Coemansia sp. RSA 986]KAJ2217078.1 hypothetical protein EV179_000845 [Coemansia sp. RSA 487]KAJ2568284.1 hypothetical protein IW140_004012 [Coemansia sp. RSA 1813]